ncbi:MAG: ferredoxin [Candidatus Marinimicrobia bacterium]|nr:ferredoxin [Candidatus Neomarinimicrobiota bacterium]
MAKVNDKCIGCEVCVNMCPEGFAMEGDKAKVINQDADCIEDAAEACPVDAIEVDSDPSE